MAKNKLSITAEVLLIAGALNWLLVGLFDLNIVQSIADKTAQIDLNELIRSRMLICANSGGGKSYAIRKILEESHGKVQQIVLDLEGEFSSLRDEFDYLLVGKDGEIPTNIRTAELLAHRILKLNVSAIIDMSELKYNERILFVKRFLDSMINAPKDLWHACLVVVDEAHIFCPEGSKSESAPSVNDLMTRGRKRGFCGVLATQRISKLNKDAAAEANNQLIGRTGLDIDMKRAADNLGFTSKEQMRSLRDLKEGEFYAFGTAIAREVTKIKVNPVKTSHPERGGKALLAPSPTPENIKKILKDLVDLPKEAQEELKSKEDMIKEISNLRRQLTLSEKNVTKEKIVTISDTNTIEKAREEGFREAESKYLTYIRPIELSAKTLKAQIIKFVKSANFLLESKALAMIGDTPLQPIKFVPKKVAKRGIEPHPLAYEANVLPSHPNRSKPEVKEIFNSFGEGEEKLGKCESMIYSFLYHNSERSFTKSQVGAVTGYSWTSGGFSNALGKLSSMGLISKNRDYIKVETMSPNHAIYNNFSKQNVLNLLGKCETEIYNVLSENPGKEFSKEELAQETPSNYSPTSGGFSNALSRLSTLGLIKKEGNIVVINPDILEL